MNISSNVPSGMTPADYNRLFETKVEFIHVTELPTENIKEYPFVYLLIPEGEDMGTLYEYKSTTGKWHIFGGGASVVPITYAEYVALSDADKQKNVFYLITDREAYLDDLSGFIVPEFIGTTAEFEAAKQRGEIKDGSIVYITDDSEATGEVTQSVDDFLNRTTVHNDDGSVTEIYADKGYTVTTSKNGNVITEVKKDMDGNVISTLTITVDEHGNIVEEVVS